MERGYDPIFLVHTSEGSESQNDAIYIRNLMKGKTFNITGSIEQTLKVYPTLHAVIAMRLHAGILSVVHGLPFIMISYGPKTDEFTNMVDNKGYTISPYDLTLDSCMKLFDDLMAHYDSRKANSLERYGTIRANLIKKLRTL